MRRYLYFLLAILGYISLSSKSCSDRTENNAASQEERLIQEKTDIKNEFESEFLPGKSLNAFESKAKQKLTDLTDYLNILSDNSISIFFKEQSKLMIFNLFISDTTSIRNRLINDADFRMVSVKEFVKATTRSGSKKIIFDSIWVTEPLHITSGLSYKGRLAFSRRMQNRAAIDSVSMPPVTMQAEFFVSKIKKSFGTDTLQVWNLSLGTIY